jgi:repressor LexA
MAIFPDPEDKKLSIGKTIGHQIAILRMERQWTQAQLAEAIGTDQGTVSHYEAGSKRPSYEKLCKIADVFGVSLDYLFKRQEQGQVRHIPLLGTVRAGIPILDQENITGYIEIPADIRADFAVQVVGDSMSWAGIAEGDIAICRLNEHPRSGQIVAVSISEAEWGATIKFYMERNGRKWLCAANPAYEDIPLDGREYRIAGVAVKFFKQAPFFHDYQRLVGSYAQENREWSGVIAEARGLGLAPQDVLDYLKIVRRHKSV